MCGNELGKEKRLPKPHGFAGNRAHEGHVGQSDRGIEELSIGQSASMYRVVVLTNMHALYRKLLSQSLMSQAKPVVNTCLSIWHRAAGTQVDGACRQKRRLLHV